MYNNIKIIININKINKKILMSYISYKNVFYFIWINDKIIR